MPKYVAMASKLISIVIFAATLCLYSAASEVAVPVSALPVFSLWCVRRLWTVGGIKLL